MERPHSAKVEKRKSTTRRFFLAQYSLHCPSTAVDVDSVIWPAVRCVYSVQPFTADGRLLLILKDNKTRRTHNDLVPRGEFRKKKKKKKNTTQHTLLHYYTHTHTHTYLHENIFWAGDTCNQYSNYHMVKCVILILRNILAQNHEM